MERHSNEAICNWQTLLQSTPLQQFAMPQWLRFKHQRCFRVKHSDSTLGGGAAHMPRLSWAPDITWGIPVLDPSTGYILRLL
jgi:hypothetical protein